MVKSSDPCTGRRVGHSLEERAKPAGKEEGSSELGEAVGVWVGAELALIGKGAS